MMGEQKWRCWNGVLRHIGLYMSVVGFVHGDWIGLNYTIRIHGVCRVNGFVCSVRL